MAKQEAPLESLADYLPGGTYPMVSQYLHQFKIHLTITRARSSILGDYRHAMQGKNHRISVNGNLNVHAFLLTLLHEIAHLLTFQIYGNRVQSHGREWKNEFAKLLKYFLEAGIFPADIAQAVRKSLHSPAASSCADDDLTRVLRRYDTNADGVVLVEDLHVGELFVIRGGRVFRKGETLRKRVQCVELKTGRVYLFSPVYEVKRLNVQS